MGEVAQPTPGNDLQPTDARDQVLPVSFSFVLYDF